MDINIKDLSEEQRKDLQKQLEEYEEKKTVWDLEEGNEYWFTNSVLGVHKDKRKHRAIDKWRRGSGSIFFTKEAAKKEAKRRLAITKVNKRIDELNDGWEPDWENTNQSKYMIYYVYSQDEFDIWNYRSTKDEIVLNYMESSYLAEQIIDEMEDELRIIFDVD